MVPHQLWCNKASSLSRLLPKCRSTSDGQTRSQGWKQLDCKFEKVFAELAMVLERVNSSKFNKVFQKCKKFKIGVIEAVKLEKCVQYSDRNNLDPWKVIISTKSGEI